MPETVAAPSDVVVRRLAAGLIAVLLGVVSIVLFDAVVTADGADMVDIVRLALLAVCATWLAWGFVTAMFGLLYMPPPVPGLAPGELPQGRTAILVPVYNEDAAAVFANLAAMHDELARLGAGHLFDFHVLSDSTSPAARADERRLHGLASAALGARIFYRNRSPNTGRKAGNIAEFVRRAGGAYAYMLVLDADSVLRGATIVEMARRIEADAGLGLVQSAPVIVGRSSLFGRALQFAAALYGPVFARGVAALQGRDGPYWGHNAIIRTRAFAACCGLPELDGRPPFGGHILSHDFVEAALLARGGWAVRVDPDLAGSYEEAPSNLLEYARRDRRWAQGNLQHARILAARGLTVWARVNLFQGILAYLASPVWLAFLAASLIAPLAAPEPVYFPERGSLFPVFPYPRTGMALALVGVVAGLLVLPKVLILARHLSRGRPAAAVSGAAMAASALAELVLSSLIAPILMMFQSRAVWQVAWGQDGGWPTAARDDGAITWAEAVRASWWMVIAGLASIHVAATYADAILPWLAPIAVPLVLAPALIVLTASPAAGERARRHGLFMTPMELAPEPVLVARARYRARWSEAVVSTPSAPAPVGPAPGAPARPA